MKRNRSFSVPSEAEKRTNDQEIAACPLSDWGGSGDHGRSVLFYRIAVILVRMGIQSLGSGVPSFPALPAPVR